MKCIVTVVSSVSMSSYAPDTSIRSLSMNSFGNVICKTSAEVESKVGNSIDRETPCTRYLVSAIKHWNF